LAEHVADVGRDDLPVGVAVEDLEAFAEFAGLGGVKLGEGVVVRGGGREEGDVWAGRSK
jgi:hypothetical protein